MTTTTPPFTPFNTIGGTAKGQLIAFYTGDHAGDGLAAQLGVGIIRWAQKGAQFADTSHCEQILAIHPNGSVDIGSATLRREHPVTGQNGVRVKRGVVLNPAHWRVYWCPQSEGLFDPTAAGELLARQDGKRYDLMGAVASAVLRVRQESARWFCSEIVLACAGFIDTWQFTPARAEAVIASYSRNITQAFFASMTELAGGAKQ
ncbi:MAG: hypothetical protein K0M67_16520 [Thiobacillus sp.]|nr:hypothetical protein [Thiobacillus sp.]